MEAFALLGVFIGLLVHVDELIPPVWVSDHMMLAANRTLRKKRIAGATLDVFIEEPYKPWARISEPCKKEGFRVLFVKQMDRFGESK